MLESYFTSLRFSEDFLKEGKVYVKNTEKERPSTPEDEVLKSIEKVPISAAGQIVNTDQQIQQPVVVSNINASNIQIISGVQARVQQYKCAMQMQPGGMAAAVVEATAETHYTYQQQTSQVSSQQSNEAQNQISDQQNQSPTMQQQMQNQIQNHSQINQPVQSQRTISQQLNQSGQLPQQQNQSEVNQQAQSQISQQLQQLQRQQREFEKQHRQLQHLEKQQVQIVTQQEFSVKQETPVVHQNDNNIVLKTEADLEPNQQIIHKIQSETQQKDESSNPGVQTYTTVQTPEVFLNLGFKESPLTTPIVRDDAKDFKEFTKPTEEGMSRNSIEQIREFLRLRSGPEPTSLITVNPQVLSQATRNNICRDCGKCFSSLNQMNNHNCNNVETLINESSDTGGKDDPLQTNVNSFSCDICSKPFKRKEHLFQHRKLHTGERPYVCTTCAKAFSRKEHLVRHSVSHTGQKMHECEMCGKSFSRKDNLHKHRKTHGVSGPYICETCGKSFVVKHYYVMHLATHATTVTDGVNCPDPLPYKCDICHKAFSVKQYLTTHKLRHRSKNNNSSAQNTLTEHQQQSQQVDTTSNVNVVTSNIGNVGNLNNSNGQSSNESTVEMQSVIERNEHANGSFPNNPYHANMQDFQ
ncbi:hypothetical protein X777_16366 [Ooceraea biroi]|nr:hypothetical protein X777_16366 [Ooceraea biroi]